MISFLRGIVTEINAANLEIDVNGIGYNVIVTPTVLQSTKRNSEINLPVVLVVREESMTLYGFSNNEERKLFELLQTVNGVGPKLALTILAATTAENLADAISQGDEASLTRIPGVGKKSAARLVLELGDKFGKQQLSKSGWQSEVHDALTALGWSAKEADSAVNAVVEKKMPHGNVAQGLKSALELLNRIGRS
jgi:Holliday junction DNA helicase RuvA